MLSLPITSILTGVCALLMVFLSVPVSLRRVKMKAPRGDAGDRDLGNLIRAHGNFIEYAPLGLLALALVEAGGWGPEYVWTVGLLLLAGRLLHAIGMMLNALPLKGAGMLATHLSFLGSGVLLLSSAWLSTQQPS